MFYLPHFQREVSASCSDDTPSFDSYILLAGAAAGPCVAKNVRTCLNTLQFRRRTVLVNAPVKKTVKTIA